jgi:thiosulfate/3-mercaptopyruvate sulfurtransferase
LLEPVVSAAWLRANRDNVVLVDVRWYLDGRNGQDAYLAGHIPGAIWADLDTVLSAPPSVENGRHPVPAPDAFAKALGQLGIGDNATVVAYDDNGGAYAARLVWLLRVLGRPAALLNGGLQAWQGTLAEGPESLPSVERAVVDWPADVFRTADEVTQAPIVLDARAPERFTGESVLPSDVRSGHIPGARNAPWARNLNENGTFATAEQLRTRYAEQGVTPGSEVIVYCGSGVTACHDLLALEVIGVRAALYPGSWSAWSADLARPIATGPSTGSGTPE